MFSSSARLSSLCGASSCALGGAAAVFAERRELWLTAHGLERQGVPGGVHCSSDPSTVPSYAVTWERGRPMNYYMKAVYKRGLEHFRTYVATLEKRGLLRDSSRAAMMHYAEADLETGGMLDPAVVNLVRRALAVLWNGWKGKDCETRLIFRMLVADLINLVGQTQYEDMPFEAATAYLLSFKQPGYDHTTAAPSDAHETALPTSPAASSGFAAPTYHKPSSSVASANDVFSFWSRVAPLDEAKAAIYRETCLSYSLYEAEFMWLSNDKAAIDSLTEASKFRPKSTQHILGAAVDDLSQRVRALLRIARDENSLEGVLARQAACMITKQMVRLVSPENSAALRAVTEQAFTVDLIEYNRSEICGKGVPHIAEYPIDAWSRTAPLTDEQREMYRWSHLAYNAYLVDLRSRQHVLDKTFVPQLAKLQAPWRQVETLGAAADELSLHIATLLRLAEIGLGDAAGRLACLVATELVALVNPANWDALQSLSNVNLVSRYLKRVRDSGTIPVAKYPISAWDRTRPLDEKMQKSTTAGAWPSIHMS